MTAMTMAIEGKMSVHQSVLARLRGLADHLSERGCRGRGTEAKEAEASLRDDGPGKCEARLNHHKPRNIGKNVPEEKSAP